MLVSIIQAKFLPQWIDSNPPAHTFFPDADDTARALMVLNNNGYAVSRANLIRKFECDDGFETFDDRMPQRVTSVSVNGNVLSCLLSSSDPSAFTPQIENIAKFMCTKWSKEKTLHDHWVPALK